MKKNILFILFLVCSIPALALHIAGGEMYYKYIGPGAAPNTDRYQITLRLFRECNPTVPPGQSAAPMPGDVTIGIFKTGPPATLLLSKDVVQSDYQVIQLRTPFICIINPPTICYQVGYFTFTQDLPQDPNGYTISYQTCCRSFLINNIEFFSIPGQGDGEGATYSCQIPGTNILGTGHNSSPVFALKDTTLICQQKKFSLDFSAADTGLPSDTGSTTGTLERDSLSYSFCSAYNRGVAENSGNVVPSTPPYQNVTYLPGFSGFQPLGPEVTIDPKTGIISGISPISGGYVVNVCVSEWRHDTLISVHRKDFILRIADCDFAAAELEPTYLTCDGFGLHFQNESTSSAIHSYFWDFGAPGINPDTSASPTPFFTYKDTGTYTVKLVVNRGEECSDSTTTLAEVYPGFFPGFKVDGSCYLNPFNFTDTTSTRYGTVNKWYWNFGDNTTNADTSVIQNPSYQYPSADSVKVTFIVANSKGCTDTVYQNLNVVEKPLINLPFKDTLICSIDSLQLASSISGGSGVFNWSPNYNIINANSRNPVVYPKDTTMYIVSVNDKGCINTDTVTVNVIDKVSVYAGNDTTICKTDSIQLKPVTDGLHFAWSPAAGLSDSSAENPLAAPLNNTNYTLVSTVGKCSSADAVNIKVAPYPLSNAGADTTICFGYTTKLHANITGAYFYWSPTNSLLNSNSLTPVAGPQSSTFYILTVTDTLGCPKPVSDTILVSVIPKVTASAGNDTTIVANQPLQLNASGGTIYTWSPATGMNNPDIFNPVVVLGASYDSIIYHVKVAIPEGCFNTDSLKVRIFKTKPDLFIPTAFTPNGDGKNDIIKPIPVGIKEFNFFRVYNRWGQMLYSTSETGQGWDGTFGGIKQASGTYVFIAEAIDYLGNKLFKKGTFVLIR